jgi:hypothetical protein
MSAKRRLAYFVGFWTLMGLLVHFGNRGVDNLLIAFWFAILIVGSVIVVFRRLRTGVHDDQVGEAHYLGSLLPRRWRYWITGEKPPEDSDKRRD